MTTDLSLCPGCDGVGVLSDDPLVLRCQSCGGVFTTEPVTVEQAMKFVNLLAPMQENAGSEGQFYFDLLVQVQRGSRPANRYHGWADTKTKRVVQFG